MIKKMIKYSLSLLAVLLLVLLLAPFFLDVDDYKAQIEQEVEDATGHHLEIGTLQASLFPWVGLTLDHVVLANRLGFEGGNLLTVEHLDVQVALLPLLSQRLEIKRFILDAPSILLQRNGQGQGNWEDLLGSSGLETQTGKVESKEPKSTKSNTTEAETSLLSALSANSIELNHGRFVWQDAVSDNRMALTDIDFELSDVQLNHPVQIKFSARLNGDEFVVKGQLGPLGDLAKLDVEHLPLQLQLYSEGLHLLPFAKFLPEFPAALGPVENARVAADVQLEQRPDGVRLLVGETALYASQKHVINFKVEMPKLDRLLVHHVNLTTDQQKLFHVQGELSRLQSKPHYQLRLQTETLKRQQLTQLIPQLEPMYAGHPAAWTALKVGASLSGDATKLDIRDMQILLDKELLQVSGRIAFAKNLDIRMRLASKALHLDPWLPQAGKGQQPVQASSIQASSKHTPTVAVASKVLVEPDLRFMKKWRVSAQLKVDHLFMRGLEMNYLRGSLKGDRGLFELDPLQFNLSQGQVREKATLNVNNYPVRWTESVHISGLKLQPVLNSLAGTDLLDGTMQLDTQLKARGLLPETSLSSLNGQGQLLLRDGRIKGFDIAGSLRNLGSLSGSQVNKYTDFAQFQASFTIKNGQLKNDDLFMASPFFRLTGHGAVDLPASKLNFHVRPKLVGSLLGQGDTLTVRKGLSVPLHIYGPLSQLAIKPELDAQSVLENVGGVLGSSGGKVGGALGGLGALLGGSKAAPSSRTPPAQIQPKSNSSSRPASSPAQIKPQQQVPAGQREVPNVQKAIEGLLGF
ncbi:MAG: AsmA family protein [Mariprofundaceae bacterium]